MSFFLRRFLGRSQFSLLGPITNYVSEPPSRTQINPILAVSLVMLVFCVASQLTAQTTVTAFLQSSALAFSPSGSFPNSLALSGTVTWTAGSDQQTGTLQLASVSDGSVSETWSIPGYSRSLSQGPVDGLRNCQYTDAAGVQHDVNDLNCLRAVPWFAPWLATQLLANEAVSAVFSTTPSDVTAGLVRVTFTPLPPPTSVPASATPMLSKATSVHVVYDAITALPKAMEYDQLLDSEDSHSMKVRVDFSGYTSEAGYMIPHHIQRYVQRTLQADITLTSVTTQ